MLKQVDEERDGGDDAEKREDGKELAEDQSQMRSTCDVCLRMKIKCDKEKPHCWTCTRKGYRCSYSKKRKPGRKFTARSSSYQSSGGEYEETKKNQPETEKRNRFQKSVLIRPNHAPSLAIPNIEGFGFQEMSFLALYHKVFQNQFPYAVDLGCYGRHMSTALLKSSSVTSDQADLVSLWSSVAIGSVFSGNKRDLSQYLDWLQHASDAGGLSAGGSAEAHARLRLALLGDVLGEYKRALDVLNECKPQVEALDDQMASMSLKAMYTFFSGVTKDSLKFMFDLVEQGCENLLESAEAAHSQNALNIFYNVVYTLFKLPFAFKTSQEQTAVAVQACHHNLTLAETVMAQFPESYSPFSHFILQETLFTVEVCFFKKLNQGLDRSRTKLIPQLRSYPFLVQISYVGVRVECILYVLWLSGDEHSFDELRTIWNSQVHMKPDSHRPMPPFQEYNPSTQCDHFRCQVAQPKLKEAVQASLASVASGIASAQEKVKPPSLITKIAARKVCGPLITSVEEWQGTYYKALEMLGSGKQEEI